MKRWALLITLCFYFILSPAGAATWFTVKKIEIEGAQGVDVGTIYNSIPIKVGEILDTRQTAEIIRAIYATGFFEDVQLKRREDTLVVQVVERAVIGKLTVSGNKDIKKEDMLKGLKNVGIAQGYTYNPSVLEQIRYELQRQYFANGKYNVKIYIDVTSLPRNRVAVAIRIKEGKAAKIQAIDIVGNNAFSKQELLSQMTLSTHHFWSILTKSDIYSKERLDADLEVLRTYYHDRGYINFKINSTQTSLTPDKRAVFITINVTEGEQFSIKSTTLKGKLIIAKEQLLPLINIKPGDIFSRKKAMESSNAIADRLAEEGFAFTQVNVIPEIDQATHTVSLTFFVNPGKRVYVRHISFSGNAKTQDEVLRREVTQMEGGWLSANEIKRSRVNILRLGYIKNANAQSKRVTQSAASDHPGSDLVDIHYQVEEAPAGGITGGFNYSDVDGFGFNAGIHQNNFLGTGKSVGFEVNHSSVYSLYDVSYFDPYFTDSGIGVGINLYYNKTNLKKAQVGSHYVMDSKGVSNRYVFPLSPDDSLSFSLGLSQSDLSLRDDPAKRPAELVKFKDEYGNQYLNGSLNVSWMHNTFDRAIFPREGVGQKLTMHTTIPGSDLQYMRFFYDFGWYKPIVRHLTFNTRIGLRYGFGYGKTKELPFFEHFYAGGQSTVRGYAERSLGPRDSLNESIGGDFRMNGSLAVIFPIPFIESDAIRASLFTDAGNVYDLRKSGPKLNEIRYSAGLAIEWNTPMGPLVFSAAMPFNHYSGDRLRKFDFTIGTPFGG